MLDPLDATAIGRVAGKEQLRLDLGAPMAMEQVMGCLEVGLSLPPFAHRIHVLGFFGAGRLEHRRRLHARCPGLR